jgi:hypothetical protein
MVVLLDDEANGAGAAVGAGFREDCVAMRHVVSLILLAEVLPYQ